MSESHDLIIDFDNRVEKRSFVERLARATGKWRVRLTRARKGRTDPQLRYYWAAHMTILHEYLTRRGWRGTKEHCHEMMKEQFSRIPEADPVTGEQIGWRTRGTGEMNAVEMADFMENVVQWMSEEFGLIVPPPDLYSTEAA